VSGKPLKGRGGEADKATEMGERLDRDPAVGVGAFTEHHGRRLERRADELHICPTCSSELVFPIDWAPARKRSWFVALRCPDCEWSGGGVHPQPVVDRFDEALDAGTDAMLNDLALLAQANMQSEAERFAAALRADHILPEDF
jgi:hypothetical protein